MVTKRKDPETPPGTLELDWEEVALALFRSRNIHDGLWRIGVRFAFAAVNAGPNDESIMPSLMGSVQRVMLVPVSEPGALIYDASRLNPQPVQPPAPKRRVSPPKGAPGKEHGR